MREEATRRTAGRTIITQLQRIPPTGKDIVPFRSYHLDCMCSKVLFLVAMMDPVKGETNPDVRLALEYKRTRDYYNRHAQSEAALYSRSKDHSFLQVQNLTFPDISILRLRYRESRWQNSNHHHRRLPSDELSRPTRPSSHCQEQIRDEE